MMSICDINCRSGARGAIYERTGAESVFDSQRTSWPQASFGSEKTTDLMPVVDRFAKRQKKTAERSSRGINFREKNLRIPTGGECAQRIAERSSRAIFMREHNTEHTAS